MSRWTKLFILVAVVLASTAFSSVALADRCVITCNGSAPDSPPYDLTVHSVLQCHQEISTYCYYRGGGWALYIVVLPDNVADLDLQDLVAPQIDESRPQSCDNLRLASHPGNPVLPLDGETTDPETAPARQG